MTDIKCDYCGVPLAEMRVYGHEGVFCDSSCWSKYRHLKEEGMNPLEVQEGGSHYKSMVIQPVEYIHKNGIPFIEGCVIKYISRWRSKNGIEDLKKAKHFIDLLIKLEEENENARRYNGEQVGVGTGCCGAGSQRECATDGDDKPRPDYTVYDSQSISALRNTECPSIRRLQ